MRDIDVRPVYEDAELYDAEFETRRHDVDFYVHQARASPGPVLELACGTGRITLAIAAAGIDIAGVDIVPEMVALARKKSAAAGVAVEWHVADVRALNLGRQFSLVFMAANALQHLSEVDSVVACLRRARAHLKPGATFILEVFNPAVEKLARPWSTTLHHKTFMADGREIEVEASSEYLRSSQTLHFELRYRSQGQVIRVKDVHMRCFYPQELLALCHLAGLEVINRFGDHRSTPFGEQSPLQIVFCRGP